MNTPNKIHRTYPILIALVALAAIVVVFGYRNFNQLTSGTEEYTGAKLDAVSSALEIDQKTKNIPEFIDNHTKLHVDSVVPAPMKTTAEGMPLPCISANHDGGQAQYFTVRISHQWIFGIRYRSKDYTLCGRANG